MQIITGVQKKIEIEHQEFDSVVAGLIQKCLCHICCVFLFEKMDCNHNREGKSAAGLNAKQQRVLFYLSLENGILMEGASSVGQLKFKFRPAGFGCSIED